jgi:hypothetical protein
MLPSSLTTKFGKVTFSVSRITYIEELEDCLRVHYGTPFGSDSHDYHASKEEIAAKVQEHSERVADLEAFRVAMAKTYR